MTHVWFAPSWLLSRSMSPRLTACSCAVASWMQSNRLQLNSDKTEVLWCATTRQHQLPRSPQLVDVTTIDPVQSVRDLGIIVDADLVMRTHVHRTVSDALRFSGSCLLSDALCQRLRSRLLSSYWYYRGWTTEMPFWSLFRPTFFADFSR